MLKQKFPDAAVLHNKRCSIDVQTMQRFKAKRTPILTLNKGKNLTG
jgi:hypothetical protein